jgi:hypothetical protein
MRPSEKMGGGWKVEGQGGAQYSLVEVDVSSNWSEFLLLVDMRK